LFLADLVQRVRTLRFSRRDADRGLARASRGGARWVTSPSPLPAFRVSPDLPAPAFDLTVRVGGSLAYEVTGSASLRLNVQPRANR
jgi:hypothetical protein